MEPMIALRNVMPVITVTRELQRQLNQVLNVQRATTVKKEQNCQQRVPLGFTLQSGQQTMLIVPVANLDSTVFAIFTHLL